MADRYLLESGTPDGYQLEDGTGVLLLEESGASQPQRLTLWKAAAVVALGFFTADEAPAAKQPSLHQFRSPAVAATGGHTVRQIGQLVLIAGEQDAVRVNHSARLLYGKATVAAATPGAPWYLWQQPARQIEPGDDARRGNHAALHKYRVGFQTIGQSYRLWPSSKPRIEADEYTLPKPVDLTAFRNSQPAATPQPGQPFFLWPRVLPRLEEEAYSVPKPSQFALMRVTQATTEPQQWFLYAPAVADQALEPDARRTDHSVNRLLFGRATPAAAISGAPWYLWVPPIQRIEPEDDARRTDQTRLHRYRQVFQTVGQPFALWPGPQQRVEAEGYVVPPPSQFALTRVTQALVTGQTWQQWIKPQQRVEAEDYSVPAPASLHPYRQITIAAQPGQPWFMWPAAVADQAIEPNPVVIDHAAALYPFRPHDAIEPPIPPVTTGPGIEYRLLDHKTPKWWAKNAGQSADVSPAANPVKPTREIKAAIRNAIAEVAKQHVSRETKQEPTRFAEVRAALKPFGKLADFNWPALYEKLYSDAITAALRDELRRHDEARAQQQAEMLRIQLLEDDALALILLTL